MLARSHIDPCFNVRFMHVRADAIPSEVAHSLQSANEKDVSGIASAYAKHFASDPRTLFHEAYHFWQSLRLPFLYRYATLGFSQYFIAFRELARQSPDFETWDCTLPSLYRLELEGYLWGRPGDRDYSYSKSKDLAPSGHARPSLCTTPLELLENAASLAEFEAFGGSADPSDPIAFGRWTKRHPAYTAVITFVAQVLASERLALLAFTPMVNAAFHTSDPVRAFAILLNHIYAQLRSEANRQIAASSPKIQVWATLMGEILDGMSFEAAEDADANILTPEFFRISLKAWMSGSYGSDDGLVLEHPMIPIPARQWEEISHFPEMQLALDHPGYLTTEHRAMVIERFFPPITIALFHFKNSANRIVLWGNPDLLSSFFGRTGIDLVDLFSIYSTVRRASGAHFDPEQRTCHWTECPHHGPNFCNSFPGVPRHDFRVCTFPTVTSSLVRIIGR